MGAAEDLKAEFRLQVLQAYAQCGLGDEQIAGRPGRERHSAMAITY